MRLAVSKNPFLPPRLTKAKRREGKLSKPEMDAVTNIVIATVGKKYRRAPLIIAPTMAGDTTRGTELDMVNLPPIMHSCNGIGLTVIRLAAPHFQKLVSEYRELAELLSSGRAPEAAWKTREVMAWMNQSEEVGGKVFRAGARDPVRPLLFSIVATAHLIQLMYSKEQFSPRLAFQLWIFAFFAWLTTSDFSQRCQVKNCTKTLYWSGLYAICSYVSAEHQTPASLLEEGGEKSFVGDGEVASAQRRKKTLEEARVVHTHKKVLRAGSSQYIAPPFSTSKARIVNKPLPRLTVHKCVFAREFPVGPGCHNLLKQDLCDFFDDYDSKLDMLEKPSTLEEEEVAAPDQDLTVSRGPKLRKMAIPTWATEANEKFADYVPGSGMWKLNFWRFMTMLFNLHKEDCKISLLPSNHYYFAVNSPDCTDTLDICYCGETKVPVQPKQERPIPIWVALMLRRFILRVGSKNAIRKLKMAINKSKSQ